MFSQQVGIDSHGRTDGSVIIITYKAMLMFETAVTSPILNSIAILFCCNKCPKLKKNVLMNIPKKIIFKITQLKLLIMEADLSI